MKKFGAVSAVDCQVKTLHKMAFFRHKRVANRVGTRFGCPLIGPYRSHIRIAMLSPAVILVVSACSSGNMHKFLSVALHEEYLWHVV